MKCLKSLSILASIFIVGANAQISTQEWEKVKEKYTKNIENFNKLATTMNNSSKYDNIEMWDENKVYANPGNVVKFEQDGKYGVFANSWWTKGDKPSFTDSYGVWKIVARLDANNSVLKMKDVIEYWDSNIAYKGGSIVKYKIDGQEHCFKAKYWTKGNKPIITGGNSGVPEWKSPWSVDENACNTDDQAVFEDNITIGKTTIEKPPVKDVSETNATEDTTVDNSPVVPPVIPAPTPEPKEKPDPLTPITKLPSSGYQFLRTITKKNWDWLFPLRYGKYNALGAVNNKPPIAKEDGTTDVFSLQNFTNAVLIYNSWAQKHNYKQFLNEGTKRQQAEEFLVFWAKSSRETSGSWATAKEPWIETNEDGTKVWKGGLYWVEELGFSTNKDGTSPAVSYIDTSSKYKPYPKRSYHGRGIIQLSWNYNYGAFSAWLYDNGILSNVIKKRDTLLEYPNLVKDNGTLSILSGIWFWMTPQGPKPSSHDVIYGDVYNVSTKTQEMGLPPRNDNGNYYTEQGDTNDEAVFAYRIGTVIDIVNGGIECNKAAGWHYGPLQRVSYYNAYAKYFNQEYPDLNSVIIHDAVDVWNLKVSDSSPENLKLSTCYSLKSYFGW